jgi:hypothetical protein
MTQPHPHLGATYRLTQTGDAFAVEVSAPGMAPTTITGFATKATAERWIAEHREAVAAGRPIRPSFRRSGKAT